MNTISYEVERFVGKKFKDNISEEYVQNERRDTNNGIIFNFVSKISSFLPMHIKTFLVEKQILYFATFVLILSILFLTKPNFLYESSEDPKDPEKKFSYKKLLIYTIIFFSLLCIIYFALENSKFLRR